MRVISKEEARNVSGGLALQVTGAAVGAIIGVTTTMMANGIAGKDLWDGVGLAIVEGALMGALPIGNAAEIAKAIWTFNASLTIRSGFAVAAHYTNNSNGTVIVSDLTFTNEEGETVGTQAVEGSSGAPTAPPDRVGTGGYYLGGGGGGGGGGTVTVTDPIEVEDPEKDQN